MRLVIVTGMSGAGKSSGMRILEDAGYFCVDNLPVSLLPTFMDLIQESDEMEKVAVGLDIRVGKKGIKEAASILKNLKGEGMSLEILYFEAKTKVLVKRYKETRRVHPLSKESRVDIGIEAERELLKNLKKNSDYIIDTSGLLIRDLKQEMEKIFVNNEEYLNFFLNFVSFGFKYGIPGDADLVFDVRFLPNPFYIDELKPLTGNDKEVYTYVMENDAAKQFLKKLKDMLDFLIPQYIVEGKNQLVVAIGCTGGKHRSVSITNGIYDRFKDSPYGCKKDHKDIAKGNTH